MIIIGPVNISSNDNEGDNSITKRPNNLKEANISFLESRISFNNAKGGFTCRIAHF